MAAPLLCSDSSGRDNNFDLLRFSFASLVILSHSYLIAWGSYKKEPLFALSRGYINLGVIAVMGFFTLSGYLICRSWERTDDAREYLKKRILRIYPGFVAVCLFCLLVAGPLGSVNPGDYFRGLPLFRSLLRMAFLVEPKSSVVFVNNPSPFTLNGSLWSLQYEFLCYLALMTFGALGILNHRGWVKALWMFCWLGHAYQLLQYHFGQTLSQAGLNLALLGHYTPYLAKPFYCGLYFFTGVVTYQHRDRIVRSPILAISALTLLLLSFLAPILLVLLMPLCGGYLLFYVAFHPEIRLYAFAVHGDFSYGLYLYGFPMQQLLVHWSGGRMHPLALFAWGLPLTLCFAAMSWYGIERPFLRWKRA